MTPPCTALLLFAKAPVAGHAKTRLIPALGPKGAAKLHAELVVHAVKTACEARLGPVQLHFSEPHPFFQRLARRYPITLHAQTKGDLGARMSAALAEQVHPAMVVGSDCPVIDNAMLSKAAAALTMQDVVILPAEDGGYGLIGLARASADLLTILFEQMPWGTNKVMEQTRQRLAPSGFTWAEPAQVWDVDEAQDLERLKALKILAAQIRI